MYYSNMFADDGHLKNEILKSSPKSREHIQMRGTWTKFQSFDNSSLLTDPDILTIREIFKLQRFYRHKNRHVVFSSPEPKAPGELIV